jgi:hypothetical protein
MGLMGNIWDYVTILASLVIGAGFILVADLPAVAKVAIVLCYLPIMYYVLILFALCFLGYVFGYWL